MYLPIYPPPKTIGISTDGCPKTTRLLEKSGKQRLRDATLNAASLGQIW